MRQLILLFKKNKWLKRLVYFFLILFIFINVLAYHHVYLFTHFEKENAENIQQYENLSFIEKKFMLLKGIKQKRPANDKIPSIAHDTITLNDKYKTHAWLIPNHESKGTVILFHGYGGCKSDLMDQSNVFFQLGYSVMLVDFMGCGNSQGDFTSLGYYESEQVVNCIHYLTSKSEKNIYLYGQSMGSVAILKALSENNVKVKGIILECPFASLLSTVKSRFKIMETPSFPLAELLVLWGGVQMDYNGFKHKPVDYAKNVHCPTLILHGLQDNRVSRKEIEDIYKQLPSVNKSIEYFTDSGHENYLKKYKNEWTKTVSNFLTSISYQ